MKKRSNNKLKIYMIQLIMLSCVLLFGCEKKQQDAETVKEQPTITSTPEVTKPAATNVPTVEPTIAAKTYSFDKMVDSIQVTIEEESENQKIICKKGDITAEYSWECDLSSESPILFTRDNLLYIILPIQGNKTYLNVDAMNGAVHTISKDTLKEIPYTDPIKELREKSGIRFEYAKSSADEDKFEFNVLVDSAQGWYQTNYIPNLSMAVGVNYEVILDDEAFYTDQLNSYRRLGIIQDEKLSWLGKFYYNLADYENEEYTFIPYDILSYTKEQGITYQEASTREKRILAGEKIVLDPDDSLDLNLDGTKEIIHYTVIPSDVNYHTSQYSLSVNDSSITYSGDNLDPTIVAQSLDGKTIQLMMFDYGPSADPQMLFYQYDSLGLSFAGVIPSYNYELTKEGIEAYCESCHIQCHSVPRLFVYQDGKIIEQEREFYPQGNTVTMLSDLSLYQEKDTSVPGITLKKGAQVIIVGSDLKEWVYIKDIDRGKCGWLRTTISEYQSDCLLPDGTKVPSTELFDGLTFYG